MTDNTRTVTFRALLAAEETAQAYMAIAEELRRLQRAAIADTPLAEILEREIGRYHTLMVEYVDEAKRHAAALPAGLDDYTAWARNVVALRRAAHLP